MCLEEYSTGVLVIGAGGAGLRATIAANKMGCRVALASLGDGATPYVIAVNAPLGHADPQDSPETYYEDMMNAGRFINDHELVWTLANNSKVLIDELETLGLKFEKENDNCYFQRHLGGSRYPRSVYYQDKTGSEAVRCMKNFLKDRDIVDLSGVRIITLVVNSHKVIGAIGIRVKTGQQVVVKANAVVLAAGGLGHTYKDTTYPCDVIGDSYGLALRAGAKLVDMEFVQFEPTVCFMPGSLKGMEMPTAMFGDGAVLLNNRGERFLIKNGIGGECGLDKALMARYIYEEISAGLGSPNGGVYFDARKVKNDFVEGYPQHIKRLKLAGIDLAVQPVEVRPASHSHMGGVLIDPNGWTGIPGLYAAGEAAGRIHGASRLAGNSGSDVLVFGNIAGREAAKYAIKSSEVLKDERWQDAVDTSTRSLQAERDLFRAETSSAVEAIRNLMSKHAGLIRKASSLENTLLQVNELCNCSANRPASEVDYLALADIVHTGYVAKTILTAALLREESRGAHCRVDFTEEREEWRRNIFFSLSQDGKIVHEIGPIIS